MEFPKSRIALVRRILAEFASENQLVVCPPSRKGKNSDCCWIRISENSCFVEFKTKRGEDYAAKFGSRIQEIRDKKRKVTPTRRQLHASESRINLLSDLYAERAHLWHTTKYPSTESIADSMRDEDGNRTYGQCEAGRYEQLLLDIERA